MLRFRWITFDRFKVVNFSRFYRVNFIRPYWVNFTVFSKKIKDFVESQLKIGEAANSAITSGMQLHPSLTNIMVNGKLASGSEMLSAHQIYKLSDVAIPEMVILDPINQAIRFNFPETDLQLGFYHQSLMTQEETAPEDRIRNN